MDFIDTNYILRFILGPSEPSFEDARKAVENGCRTLPESISKTIFVLEGVYRVTRERIAETLIALLDDIEIERKEIIVEALAFYGYGTPKLDYVDCLYLAVARLTGEKVLTLDKKLARQLQKLNEEA